MSSRDWAQVASAQPTSRFLQLQPQGSYRSRGSGAAGSTAPGRGKGSAEEGSRGHAQYTPASTETGHAPHNSSTLQMSSSTRQSSLSVTTVQGFAVTPSPQHVSELALRPPPWPNPAQRQATIPAAGPQTATPSQCRAAPDQPDHKAAQHQRHAPGRASMPGPWRVPSPFAAHPTSRDLNTEPSNLTSRPPAAHTTAKKPVRAPPPPAAITAVSVTAVPSAKQAPSAPCVPTTPCHADSCDSATPSTPRHTSSSGSDLSDVSSPASSGRSCGASAGRLSCMPDTLALEAQGSGSVYDVSARASQQALPEPAPMPGAHAYAHGSIAPALTPPTVAAAGAATDTAAFSMPASAAEAKLAASRALGTAAVAAAADPRVSPAASSAEPVDAPAGGAAAAGVAAGAVLLSSAAQAADCAATVPRAECSSTCRGSDTVPAAVVSVTAAKPTQEVKTGRMPTLTSATCPEPPIATAPVLDTAPADHTPGSELSMWPSITACATLLPTSVSRSVIEARLCSLAAPTPAAAPQQSAASPAPADMTPMPADTTTPRTPTPASPVSPRQPATATTDAHMLPQTASQASPITTPHGLVIRTTANYVPASPPTTQPLGRSESPPVAHTVVLSHASQAPSSPRSLGVVTISAAAHTEVCIEAQLLPPAPPGSPPQLPAVITVRTAALSELCVQTPVSSSPDLPQVAFTVRAAAGSEVSVETVALPPHSPLQDTHVITIRVATQAEVIIVPAAAPHVAQSPLQHEPRSVGFGAGVGSQPGSPELVLVTCSVTGSPGRTCETTWTITAQPATPAKGLAAPRVAGVASRPETPTRSRSAASSAAGGGEQPCAAESAHASPGACAPAVIAAAEPAGGAAVGHALAAGTADGPAGSVLLAAAGMAGGPAGSVMPSSACSPVPPQPGPALASSAAAGLADSGMQPQRGTPSQHSIGNLALLLPMSPARHAIEAHLLSHASVSPPVPGADPADTQTTHVVAASQPQQQELQACIPSVHPVQTCPITHSCCTEQHAPSPPSPRRPPPITTRVADSEAPFDPLSVSNPAPAATMQHVCLPPRCTEAAAAGAQPQPAEPAARAAATEGKEPVSPTVSMLVSAYEAMKTQSTQAVPARTAPSPRTQIHVFAHAGPATQTAITDTAPGADEAWIARAFLGNRTAAAAPVAQAALPAAATVPTPVHAAGTACSDECAVAAAAAAVGCAAQTAREQAHGAAGPAAVSAAVLSPAAQAVAIAPLPSAVPIAYPHVLSDAVVTGPAGRALSAQVAAEPARGAPSPDTSSPATAVPPAQSGVATLATRAAAEEQQGSTNTASAAHTSLVQPQRPAHSSAGSGLDLASAMPRLPPRARHHLRQMRARFYPAAAPATVQQPPATAQSQAATGQSVGDALAEAVARAMSEQGMSAVRVTPLPAGMLMAVPAGEVLSGRDTSFLAAGVAMAFRLPLPAAVTAATDEAALQAALLTALAEAPWLAEGAAASSRAAAARAAGAAVASNAAVQPARAPAASDVTSTTTPADAADQAPAALGIVFAAAPSSEAAQQATSPATTISPALPCKTLASGRQAAAPAVTAVSPAVAAAVTFAAAKPAAELVAVAAAPAGPTDATAANAGGVATAAAAVGTCVAPKLQGTAAAVGAAAESASPAGYSDTGAASAKPADEVSTAAAATTVDSSAAAPEGASPATTSQSAQASAKNTASKSATAAAGVVQRDQASVDSASAAASPAAASPASSAAPATVPATGAVEAENGSTDSGPAAASPAPAQSAQGSTDSTTAAATAQSSEDSVVAATAAATTTAPAATAQGSADSATAAPAAAAAQGSADSSAAAPAAAAAAAPAAAASTAAPAAYSTLPTPVPLKKRTRPLTKYQPPEQEYTPGGLPPFARKYLKDKGALPWHGLTDDGNKAPWLPHLPPEAKGSLYQWGWYLFTQTEEGKKGEITKQDYDEINDPQATLADDAPDVDILLRLAFAFAMSPLSIMVDIRGAAQCIEWALRYVRTPPKDKSTDKPADDKGAAAEGTSAASCIEDKMLVSVVERELDYLCAAGCPAGKKGLSYSTVFGKSVCYCNYDCATKHIASVPDHLKIYLCWPRGLVDDLYWDEELAVASTPSSQALAKARRRAEKRKRRKLRLANPLALPAPDSTATATTDAAPSSNSDAESPAAPVVRLTEADLARLSDDLAWVPWVVASRDTRPMLWHVRRRTLERVAARMGLPAAGVQGLLWVASQRGDVCGALTALAKADPTGQSLPPDVRQPYRMWAALLELTAVLVFYTLSEASVHGVLSAFLRAGHQATDGPKARKLVHTVCAMCGLTHSTAAPLIKCKGCMSVSLCSPECRKGHAEGGLCKLLSTERQWASEGRTLMPQSFTTRKAKDTPLALTPAPSADTPRSETPDNTSDVSSTATTQETNNASSRDQGSPTTSQDKPSMTPGQAIAAEYELCADSNPHLRRLANVIMPPPEQRDVESPAMIAAHQLLVCAAGLLSYSDIVDVVRALYLARFKAA